MIICRVRDPVALAGWRPVCEMEECSDLPTGPIAFEYPTWSESVIERSFLKQPELLAKAVHATSEPNGLIALSQVARIDLYLRVYQQLHLIELKKATGYGKWEYAAAELAGQWCRSAAWLRKGIESVHLWVLSPVRWSRSRRTAKIPSNWRKKLDSIMREQLTGQAHAKIGMLFYGFSRVGSDRYLLLWQADEPTPAFDLRGALLSGGQSAHEVRRRPTSGCS
jgi:hypothetical protein